jgi:hypothetical protein
MDTIQATEAQMDAAKTEEQAHLDHAMRAHLQQRVVLLNVENQVLRARVAELEALVDRRDPAPEPADPMLERAAG